MDPPKVVAKIIEALSKDSFDIKIVLYTLKN